MGARTRTLIGYGGVLVAPVVDFPAGGVLRVEVEVDRVASAIEVLGPVAAVVRGNSSSVVPDRQVVSGRARAPDVPVTREVSVVNRPLVLFHQEHLPGRVLDPAEIEGSGTIAHDER